MVNHDGGEGTLVWSAGALPKRRRLVHAVCAHAMLPGPLAIWASGWINVPASAISVEVGVFVEWVTFLSSLQWPVGGADLCVGGVSYIEMLILMSYGLVRGWLEKKPILGILGQGAQFQCRLFL